ncbi:hypothetical protein NEFER03_2072 [Nematocida sp. LUAm3]|nr:hypothetical protein NEFER03_2072 [Nematocida sp. LUAm3]KAI5176210.1 hypothetical protein NEFER02_2016 [Nematocida sp. LUAm2]KAI5179198.1 hypothetical protein NEFER01_2055 [Nematocida sp. LUAm1]
MVKKFLALFHKHFQREVAASSDLQRAVARIALARESLPVRVLLPLVRAAGGVSSDVFSLFCGSLLLGDAAVSRTVSFLWRRSSSSVESALCFFGAYAHAGALSIGRRIFRGTKYMAPLEVHCSVLHSELRNVPRNVLHSELRSELLNKYISAVIVGSKYQEMSQRYSPGAWRHLEASYAPYELLKVHSVLFSGNPRTATATATASFTSDMYREHEDKVNQLRSTWTLSASGNEYHIHKVHVETMQ